MIQARILAFLAAHWLDFTVAILLAVVVVGFAKHERNVQAAKDAAIIAMQTKRLNADVDAFKRIKADIDANNAARAEAAAQAKASIATAHRREIAAARKWRDALAQQRASYKGDACGNTRLPDGVQ